MFSLKGTAPIPKLKAGFYLSLHFFFLLPILSVVIKLSLQSLFHFYPQIVPSKATIILHPGKENGDPFVLSWHLAVYTCIRMHIYICLCGGQVEMQKSL